jgi:hypothetical protein
MALGSLAFIDFVAQELNHPFPTYLLQSAPEPDQVLDIHHF